MKIVLLVAFALSVVIAIPVDDNKAEVIKSEIVNNGDKGYSFDVETSDGSKHQEVGTFRYVGGLAVRGSYEFVDDDGKVHKVNYVADEKGFRPEIVD
ncbi:CLUMA_CG016565, isoform A [Clunio marinus]|uniref:CLUMA_CG016565, isoform A n=1 Tax=Clunio marinus TaxID=568069 RepID=A0A1J1IRV4_9DIPT|nr:CLUMA_CG016565, isoform A [Clunio marinus]